MPVNTLHIYNKVMSTNKNDYKIKWNKIILKTNRVEI